MSSYRSVLEDLFGVRFIAIGVPIEQIDKSLKPGDLEFVARTKDAYVYENPRALPRVMLATEWRKADFDAMIRDGGWPDVDPRRTVLLENAPAGCAEAVGCRRHRTHPAAIATPTSRSKPTRRAAASSCSTTSGIRGGGPPSTASRRKS